MVLQHILQRLEHMGIAKVPGCARAVVHEPIILFGFGNEPRILSGIEEGFTITQFIGLPFFEQFDEDVRHSLLALAIVAMQRRSTISRRVRLPRRQASVSLPSNGGELRVDRLQIIDNDTDRRIEAIEV